MTNSKMIKILSSYEDAALFEIRDSAKYDFEKNMFTNPVREVVLLSDIIKEFENQSGQFYNDFSGRDFKELIKIIESGNRKYDYYKKYEDSYQEFLTKWAELHPDESYEEYEKRMNKKRREESKRLFSTVLGSTYRMNPEEPILFMNPYGHSY